MPPSSPSDSDVLARAAALAADPTANAAAALADALTAKKSKDAAAAWDATSTIARESGAFALAVYAARALDALDAARAKNLIGRIATLYGAGSARASEDVPPRPETPVPVPAEAPGTDVAAAVKKALAAANAKADGLARAAGKVPSPAWAHAAPPDVLAALIGKAQPLVKDEGQALLTLGDDATAIFLVARGLLGAFRDDVELGRLRAGAFVGEIALLAGTRRTATVRALEPSWLVEIPATALEEAARKAPALADALARAARQRLLSNVMRTSELFQRLKPEDQNTLMKRFRPTLSEDGAVLATEGVEGEALHVVVSGEVAITRNGALVAEAGPGDVLGEISLLARKPATATATTRGRTVTLALDRAGFDDVAQRYPAVLAEVYRLASQRDAGQSQSIAVVDVEHEEPAT